MNPADVAQSVLPLTSSDLSLFTLFWHAHWIVKAVMIGLLVCSVWVWAIAIDKTVLYTRTRRAMDRFETGILVRPVAGGALPLAVFAADPLDGGAVRRGHARMEAQLRGRSRAPSPACRCASRRSWT